MSQDWRRSIIDFETNTYFLGLDPKSKQPLFIESDKYAFKFNSEDDAIETWEFLSSYFKDRKRFSLIHILQ